MSRRIPLTTGAQETEVRGDLITGELLRRAFAGAEGDADLFTHGFHSYPARMHPGIPRVLIAEIERGGVLDPFGGSGTVAVEAIMAGRRVVSVDLNPIAQRIAEVKTAVRAEDARELFVRTAKEIAVRSEERVRGRVPARAPLSRHEVGWYEPHTLKELAGLREEILAVKSVADRRALEMVLSAIVVKFSRQRADTAERTVAKKIRKGLPTEFFLRRCEELAERWEALADIVPPKTRKPVLVLGDVRDLGSSLPKGFRAGLVVTSPPYGGTYDYVDHHARRYPWLGLDGSALDEGEIGARRRSDEKGAAARWDRELSGTLRAIRGTLHDDGLAVLLIGDGRLEGEDVPADLQVERLAPDAGFRVLAVASQMRPDWQGGEPRREHLVALAP